MSYRVVFSPEATEQLVSLFQYIADSASAAVAANYLDGLVRCCENLQAFPFRGTARDDVRPGLRVTNYKKRTVIAYAIDHDLISIVGVFYGGQDYMTYLEDDSDEAGNRP